MFVCCTFELLGSNKRWLAALIIIVVSLSNCLLLETINQRVDYKQCSSYLTKYCAWFSISLYLSSAVTRYVIPRALSLAHVNCLPSALVLTLTFIYIFIFIYETFYLKQAQNYHWLGSGEKVFVRYFFNTSPPGQPLLIHARQLATEAKCGDYFQKQTTFNKLRSIF